jgi:hypothetical protein
MNAVRPPAWLIAITAAMAAILLAMAVTETSFKGQYLIDQGEYLSLVGLGFILLAGVYLYRRQRLVVSMPLVLPWLFYPVITQGDQIIDNLPINAMRWIVHILLAAIFAMPVAVIVMAARYTVWRDLGRERTAMLAVALLTLEMILANLFLGTLMIITLVVTILAVILYAWRQPPAAPADPVAGRSRAERTAVMALVAGVVISGGLYLGFKNRPGAYQGSPSFYMDPAQPGAGFNFEAIAVPARPAAAPAEAEAVQTALAMYARSLEKLLDGYYVLDRNYNYHFHNELFLRSTPLLPDYRAAGLRLIEEAAALRTAAEPAADQALASLDPADPLAALIADVRGYVAFNFERAATLERMSGVFETSQAGLQHATHIYEGEGKFLGVSLARLLDKHQAVLAAPAATAVTHDFVTASRGIHDAYANRIVGF